MSRLREVYFKFSPDGSATSIALSAAQISGIGRFSKMYKQSIITPITYYSVSSNNNEFVLLTAGDGVNKVSNVLTIPIGNYTSDLYASTIKTILDNTSDNDRYTAVYTVSISTTTGKLAISVASSEAGYAGFKIEFYTGNNATTESAAKRMQAEKLWGVTRTTIGATVSTPQIGGGSYITSYTSALPAILWGPDILLLVSPELERMMTERNQDIVDAQTNIIAQIPVSNSAFGQQLHMNEVQEIPIISNQLLPSTITLNITDELGNAINFNGGTCYLNLVVR